MTVKNKFLDSLKRSGIKKGGCSYQDYELAKKLIPKGIAKDYEKYIRWVVEYVGV